MFRTLARLFTPAVPDDPAVLFRVHPLQLSRWLEEAWIAASRAPVLGGVDTNRPPFLGSKTIVTDLDLPPAPGIGGTVLSGIDLNNPTGFVSSPFAPGSALAWDHLIYAYLIESTGALEIFAEVLRRLAVGETLEELRPSSARWARTTEELFFRDPPSFSIGSVVSQLRVDQRVNRRNAYWRMFGLDLSHPIPPRWAPAGVPPAAWKLDTGNGVNTGFREKWGELLRQLWLGIENQKNLVGANATDREYVSFLCEALSDMMQMRRRGGQLAREEFAYVNTMSWFHLTLETDTPIVLDLKASATSPADRLAKIGDRVGMAPAPRSRELFELADPMSALLRAIELSLFNTGSEAETMYLPIPGNDQLREDVNRVIDLWQSATGDRVKDRPVGGVGVLPAPQPVRIPTPAPTRTVPALASASNGRRV